MSNPMVTSGRRRPRLSLHLDPSLSVGDMVVAAQRAEAAGFDAVHGIEALRDVFVPMTAIAAATSRIELGTYVANAYARTPQAAATAASNLDELSGGRFTLGLGCGNRHINEWFFGLDSSKPMQKLRDYLAVVNAMVSGDAPAAAEVGGVMHHMQRRFVRPTSRRVPVVLAAAGPRMIELAASATDGVGLGILVSTDHLAEIVRPRAVAAAAAAGRDPERLRFPMAAMVHVHEDAEHARRLTRRAICGLFHPIPHPYYDFLLREQGAAAVAAALTELAPQRRWDEAMATIDDDLVDRLTITGTPEQCAARLRDYDGVADEIICLGLGPALAGAADGGSTDAVMRMVTLARQHDRDAETSVRAAPS